MANTGPVVSPADADRIFQPFERLNDRTSHDGSGLGLTIVASIAAIQGGTATARPRNNGGLSVTVTIPSAGTPAQGGKEYGQQSPDNPAIGRRALVFWISVKHPSPTRHVQSEKEDPEESGQMQLF